MKGSLATCASSTGGAPREPMAGRQHEDEWLTAQRVDADTGRRDRAGNERHVELAEPHFFQQRHIVSLAEHEMDIEIRR